MRNRFGIAALVYVYCVVIAAICSFVAWPVMLLIGTVLAPFGSPPSFLVSWMAVSVWSIILAPWKKWLDIAPD